MIKLIFSLVVILTSSFVYADSLEFFYGSDQVKELNVKQLQEKKVTSQELYNPFRKHSKKYKGVDFFKLLDEVYGPKWRQASTIRFKALDGFVQNASIKKMLQASKKHSGLIAFSDREIKGFSEFKKNGKIVNPGPFYLVWTHYENRSIANYNDDLKWPYQLKSIYIIE